jgi:hypothetical protein
MKQEIKILSAFGIGFFAILGVCLFKKRCSSKINKNHSLYLYTDEHRHFDISENKEDHHGVELDVMK